MSDYATAIYLKSTDKAALLDFIDDFKHAMEPQEGRAVVPESVDEEGNTIPAQPQIGELGTWYTCVMLFPNMTLVIDSAVELADEETVGQLCGKYA